MGTRSRLKQRLVWSCCLASVFYGPSNGWIACGPQMALAAQPIVQGPPAYRPLSLEALLSPRIRFQRGVPMVSVGIKENAQLVEIEGPKSALRLMFEENGTPKTIYIDARTPVRFLPQATQKANRKWWARVATLPEVKHADMKKKQRHWTSPNWRTRVERTGALLALGGQVLDTRRRELLVGGFASRVEAVALADKLYQERAVRAVVRPTLLRPGRGTVTVMVGGRSLATARDSVYVGSTDGSNLAVGDRRYSGHLYVAVGPEGGLALINSVDAETLLRGVVPAEIFAAAPAAALEAQAIVARGAILSLLGNRHFDAPFHLCDEQHCQVYRGAGAAQRSTDLAVRTTRGQVAVRPRSGNEPLRLVESVYSASCGGFTEGNAQVWDETPSPSLRPRLDGPAQDPALSAFRDGVTEENLEAWLTGVPPVYCARSKFTRMDKFRWKKVLTEEDLKAIGQSLGIGRPKAIEVLGRGKGGRVTGVRVVGTNGQREVLRELPVRRLFNNLNSGAFKVETKTSEGVLVQAFFRGAGWGHGVGMCQMGAIGRAEAGQSAAEILRFYYSGAELTRLYE